MGDRVLRRVEAGAGRPDVVLEAGRNDVAASWRPVMRLLTPHVHVVAYDRAGLGGSAPSADPVILARQVADLESVITSATAGPCVLVRADARSRPARAGGTRPGRIHEVPPVPARNTRASGTALHA